MDVSEEINKILAKATLRDAERIENDLVHAMRRQEYDHLDDLEVVTEPGEQWVSDSKGYRFIPRRFVASRFENKI